MKLVICLIAGIAIGALTLSTEAAQTPAAQPASTQALSTNTTLSPISGTADQGMTLNWRGVSVDRAIDLLAKSAGVVIYRLAPTGPNAVSDTVNIVSEKPLFRDEIVGLLKKVLVEHGLAARQDNNTIIIETSGQAMADGNTPIKMSPENASDIPANAEIVTEIIALHSLSPSQIVKDLFGLVPEGTMMSTNDAGNAIIMTAAQTDIRRFVEIIRALDSTGNGEVAVLFLQNSDAKLIAGELKDLFNIQDNTPGANPFASLTGARVGARSGANSGNTGDAGRRATPHINAVADETDNAILVSAPADFMPGISNTIHQLDIRQDDDVEIRRFALRNADCTEIANELASVFPDLNGPNNQNGNNRNLGEVQVPGRGTGGGNGGAAMSERMKKQATVNAIPDPRTQSVIVTASVKTMKEIELLIKEMDSDPAGHISVYFFRPIHADVLDLVGPLQDTFQTSATANNSSTSSQMNALSMRIQAGAQAAASSLTSSSSGRGEGNSGTGNSSAGR